MADSEKPVCPGTNVCQVISNDLEVLRSLQSLQLQPVSWILTMTSTVTESHLRGILPPMESTSPSFLHLALAKMWLHQSHLVQ